ncbi:hypothetical protein BCR39DRAFT_538296 [Naematelia encephala]|uniref:Translation initiation factor IF-2, mitochondrial n=1 Tax=Naematelia encephala TaxID=71784 RepID=A0A1Y2AY57_9TREE|nr:hypothetical protein BCR39DRAFT_538296 [Naematelia encephala]
MSLLTSSCRYCRSRISHPIDSCSPISFCRTFSSSSLALDGPGPSRLAARDWGSVSASDTVPPSKRGVPSDVRRPHHPNRTENRGRPSSPRGGSGGSGFGLGGSASGGERRRNPNGGDGQARRGHDRTPFNFGAPKDLGPPLASGFGLKSNKGRDGPRDGGSRNTGVHGGNRDHARPTIPRGRGPGRSVPEAGGAPAKTDSGSEVALAGFEGDQGDDRSDIGSDKSLSSKSVRSAFGRYVEDGVILDRRLERKRNPWSHQTEEAEPAPIRSKAKPKRVVEVKAEREVVIPSTVTVGRLANIFGTKLFPLQAMMARMGMPEEQRRPDYLLTAEQACDVALEYGLNPIIDDERAFDILPEPEVKDGTEYPLRPPVITIMGHVDHGKTTLLDALRNTAVAQGEAGGITQHIGAFSVPLSSLTKTTPATADSTLTFLDTPGHAAFTGMRARGASVTDIIVLVVAADDGVMPQTREVINLWKSEADKVGLVVAINKIDKPGVDTDKIKASLAIEEVYLEEDGGEVPSVKVSGLNKLGLDDLVETLSTVAELRDIRARRDGKAEGYVLESNVDRGRGNVATVLVTRGTLKAGSIVVAGTTYCRVRQMQNDKGKAVKEALPGTPVSLTGWKDLPTAGDQLLEAINGESEARKAVANRLREIEQRKMILDVEQINIKRREERAKAEAEEAELEAVRQAGGNVEQAKRDAQRRSNAGEIGGKKELRLIIKGDVSGTVEAVVGSLENIGNKEAGVKIVHTAVGEVSESDIAMAQAVEGHVIGFNVACSRVVTNQAKTLNVPLHLESVIYRLIETVRKETAALLPPAIETRVIGEGVVSQVYTINAGKKTQHKVAGCKAVNGVISRLDKVRVLRGSDRQLVFEGEIDSLKHVKKDVDEIRKGMEFGIQLKGFDDLQAQDEIVTIKEQQVARTL